MTTNFRFNVSDEFGKDVTFNTDEDEEIYNNEAEMYVEVFKRFMRAVGFVEDTIEEYIAPSDEDIPVREYEAIEDDNDEESEGKCDEFNCQCRECQLERLKEYLHKNTTYIPKSTTTTTNNQTVKLVWTSPIYAGDGHTENIFLNDTRKGKK